MYIYQTMGLVKTLLNKAPSMYTYIYLYPYLSNTWVYLKTLLSKAYVCTNPYLLRAWSISWTHPYRIEGKYQFGPST